MEWIQHAMWLVLAGLWLGMATAVSAAPPAPGHWRDAYAEMRGDQLVIGNSLIRRVFDWNKGDLASVSLTDVKTGKELVMQKPQPDMELGKLLGKPKSGSWKATVVKQFLGAAHIEVEVTTSFEAVDVRRVFRIYADCPAIGCDIYLKAGPKALPAFRAEDTVLQQLSPPGPHWYYQAVEFFDRTDGCNNLVAEREVPAFGGYGTDKLTGNLLFATSPVHDTAFFLVKEAPCSFVQLDYPGCDFQVSGRTLRTVGMGVGTKDLPPGEWVRVYGLATGVSGNSRLACLAALRAYQKNLRVHQPQRDDMILMNNWGDRRRGNNIGEEFVKREVDACARLGVSILQVDDGWQQGLSTNSGKGGRLWENWEEKDWQPNAERFPNGFRPVVEYARAKGVKLGLWFHPSTGDDYKLWKRDADILLNLYRNFDVRIFKIDGIKLPTKLAETNLRRFFDRIAQESGGKVVVNVDATANNRTGYHYFSEYGNIFLENRYTDWGNYYPYRTLRNLWMLSRYVPAERLQIEFLNKWRCPNKYSPKDPLAPQNVPFDYVVGLTLMAQPLAWCEVSHLPEEAFEQGRPILDAYRKHQAAIHQGTILPIGEEPTGGSWTGFQSIGDDGQGYVAVYREFNERPQAQIQLLGLRGKRIAFEKVCGRGDSFTATVSEAGYVAFKLPSAHSFALYRYSEAK